jgi:hypothetical protein
MPVVTLTVAKTLTGTQAADSLQGGGTGVDLGTVANGATTSGQNLFVKHDGTQKITGLSYYIQAYSGTYGGNYTAAGDYAKLKSLGDGSDGYQVCEVWNESPTFTTLFQVATGAGDSFAARRTVPTTAMIYNNAGAEAAASSPVAGEVGPSGNTVLGSFAKLRERIKIPGAEVDGGYRQFDVVFAYNYTT